MVKRVRSLIAGLVLAFHAGCYPYVTKRGGNAAAREIGLGRRAFRGGGL